jgi:GNAT superfamily N-acetyltransferase
MRLPAIRSVALQDIDVAANFLSAMVKEMADVGGHSIQDSDQVSIWFRDHIHSLIDDADHLFLLAEIELASRISVGLLEASIANLHPAFLPLSSLHIHAVYVAPRYRRAGVARSLFDRAFEWGRKNGCVEVDLNVLQHSPAKKLYQELGFEIFQVEMRRKL